MGAISLVKKSSSFKIVIPEEVEAKIRHLCSAVYNTEWSGKLFYRPKGTIDDGNFEVECVDILVMDIGSSTFTEYADSPDIIAYMADHDLLDGDIQEGLIHSHHSMQAYFSGTDQNTLKLEGNDSNHFVSLIVNNRGDYVAAVTRKIVIETQKKIISENTTTEYYDTYGGQRIILRDGVRTLTQSEGLDRDVDIEWYDLEVVKPTMQSAYVELDERLMEIKSRKPRGTVVYEPTALANSFLPKTPKQLSLFDLNNDLESEYHYRKDIVDSLLVQLITGSPFATNNVTELKSLVANLDIRYEQRFGLFDGTAHPNVVEETLKNNHQSVEYWLSGLIETLLEAKDYELAKQLQKENVHDCESYMMSVLASDLTREIVKLKSCTNQTATLTIMEDILCNYIDV